MKTVDNSVLKRKGVCEVVAEAAELRGGPQWELKKILTWVWEAELGQRGGQRG